MPPLQPILWSNQWRLVGILTIIYLGAMGRQCRFLIVRMPRGGCRRLSLGWKALDIPKPLALVTLLDELPCIYLHSRLEVTCSNNFTYQGSGASMVSAHLFIDVFQNIPGFLFIHAFQVGYGKASLKQVSFKIMNLATLFLTFLASSTSCGRCPS